MEKKKRTTLRDLIRFAAFVIGIVAIVGELRKPREERTWNGTVGGIVPYDFRKPTLERARSRWWNPNEDRVFVPQVFGVGWTVNLNRVGRLVGLVPAA
jgi:hypothetical protein